MSPAEYHPRDVDAAAWARVGTLVNELLTDPSVPTELRTKVRRPLAELACTLDTAGHRGLAAALLLREDVIEGYIATLPARRAATYRSSLRALRKVHVAGAAATHQPIAKAPSAAPYHPDEVERMLSHAAALRNGLRRQRAGAMLLLGVGAGLDSREFGDLPARSVTRRADGIVTVTVTGSRKTRTVAVLDRYANRLTELTGSLDPDVQLVRQPATAHLTGYAMKALDGYDGQAVTGPRLRATFLALHLVGGTPLDVLLRQFGTSGLRDIGPVIDAVASWGHLKRTLDDHAIAAKAWR